MKIIGFDSWTGGSHHYQRLLPALAERSMQLTLVHIGSWGNEPNCPDEQRIGALLVRDIKYYGGDYFERILDIEQPDAVILLSTDTFAHRAFIRYCNKRSIPTLNLYHGLVAGSGGQYVADSYGQTGRLKFSRVARSKYVLSKIGKLLRHTLPCYIESIFKTKSTYQDWFKFILNVVQLAVGTDLQVGKAAADAKTTVCAVYVKEDAEHAMHCYGFVREDVFIVGNPDLITFGLEQNMIGSWVLSVKAPQKSIMYIETGYSSLGLFFASTQEFVKHLLETSNCLAQQGYKMLLKLKPKQVNSKLIEQSLVGSNIEIIANRGFLAALSECSACIVEATTLAMLPALMGMPLLLARYGDLRTLSFGSVFVSYPRSHLLEDISDLTKILLMDAQTVDRKKLNEWIDLNVGPLPPEKMPERVAATVEEMIAGAKRHRC